MKRFSALLLFVLLALAASAQDAESAPSAAAPEKPAEKSVEEKRIETIRYGTDAEIAELLKTLRNEAAAEPAAASDEAAAPATDTEKELAALAEATTNKIILAGIFSFFADGKKSGLEDRALKAVADRDDEAFETVAAGIDYLGRLECADAVEPLREILNGEESRYLNASIRALGRIAKKSNPEEAADFLVDYYENRSPGDENRRDIIIALGDVKSKKAVPFLVSIVENGDERAPLRMAALSGLASIADEAGLPAIIKAASSADPNVRSQAVAALGPFPGEQADKVVLEAFRDSYYRTRIAAAQAARDRKLAAAVPYLVFRAENDEVPQVRDESIKALGAIADEGAVAAVSALFKERKNSDRVRVNAANALLSVSGDALPDIIAELDWAKQKNQTALYNGFLRVLAACSTGAENAALADLAKRFFSSGGVSEKSAALDICLNNGLRSFEDDIRALADPPPDAPRNGGLSKKAKTVLEKWESGGAEKTPAAELSE